MVVCAGSFPHMSFGTLSACDHPNQWSLGLSSNAPASYKARVIFATCADFPQCILCTVYNAN